MLDQCPHCEKPFIDSQVTQGRCPHCEEALGTIELEKTHNSREMEAFTPLMEHTELGLLARFWGTVAQVLFKPNLFFQSLTVKSEQPKASEPAYLFGILCLFIGQTMASYWVMQFFCSQPIDSDPNSDRTNPLGQLTRHRKHAPSQCSNILLYSSCECSISR